MEKSKKTTKKKNLNQRTKTKNNTVLDLGNSNIHWGIFQNNALILSGTNPIEDISSLPWKTFKKYSSKIYYLTVNKIAEKKIKTLCKKHKIAVNKITKEIQSIIKNTYTTLGDDRVFDLMGGINKYKNSPIIICNFGTATTISACDKKHNFIGGLIKAGIISELKLLANSTDLLPLIQINTNKITLQAQSTKEAILGGVITSNITLIKEFIQKIKDTTMKNPKIIFTGGNASIISRYYKNYDLLDESLSLRGMNYFLNLSCAK